MIFLLCNYVNQYTSILSPTTAPSLPVPIPDSHSPPAATHPTPPSPPKPSLTEAPPLDVRTPPPSADALHPTPRREDAAARGRRCSELRCFVHSLLRSSPWPPRVPSTSTASACITTSAALHCYVHLRPKRTRYPPKSRRRLAPACIRRVLRRLLASISLRRRPKIIWDKGIRCRKGHAAAQAPATGPRGLEEDGPGQPIPNLAAEGHRRHQAEVIACCFFFRETSVLHAR